MPLPWVNVPAYFKCVCIIFCRRSDAMVRFFHHRFFASSRKRVVIFLAFAWCAGLILGCVLALLSTPFSVSMMRTIRSTRVSIVGLLAILYLPLFISAFAVYISQIWLLIPICFTKAFSFSFVALGVSLAYPAGSWLLRFFLLFSDCLAIPCLYWSWYRGCENGRRKALQADALVSIPLFLIGIADYYCISPFLSNLSS